VSGDRIDPYDLNRELEVWRPELADDGQGGQSETLVEVGDPVRAKVNEPTAAERIEAMRSGVDLSYQIHLLPEADVRRGDELRAVGEVFRVLSTVRPSTPTYLRAQCERDEVEMTDES
jgi:head-tail adaptor